MTNNILLIHKQKYSESSSIQMCVIINQLAKVNFKKSLTIFHFGHLGHLHNVYANFTSACMVIGENQLIYAYVNPFVKGLLGIQLILYEICDSKHQFCWPISWVCVTFWPPFSPQTTNSIIYICPKMDCRWVWKAHLT